MNGNKSLRITLHNLQGSGKLRTFSTFADIRAHVETIQSHVIYFQRISTIEGVGEDVLGYKFFSSNDVAVYISEEIECEVIDSCSIRGCLIMRLRHANEEFYLINIYRRIVDTEEPETNYFHELRDFIRSYVKTDQALLLAGDFTFDTISNSEKSKNGFLAMLHSLHLTQSMLSFTRNDCPSGSDIWYSTRFFEVQKISPQENALGMNLNGVLHISIQLPNTPVAGRRKPIVRSKSKAGVAAGIPKNAHAFKIWPSHPVSLPKPASANKAQHTNLKSLPSRQISNMSTLTTKETLPSSDTLVTTRLYHQKMSRQRNPDKYREVEEMSLRMKNVKTALNNEAGLHIISHNIQSFSRTQNYLNLFLLENYVEVNQPHILLIQETFLSSDIPSAMIMIKNYSLERLDKAATRGGVLMYIRSDLQYDAVATSSSLELILIRIRFENQPIYVATSYRRPGTELYKKPPELFIHVKQYFEEMDRFLSAHISANDALIIGGDFNVATAPTDKNPVLKPHVKEFLDKFNLLPSVHVLTTKKNSNPDNIFFSKQLFRLLKTDVSDRSLGKSIHKVLNVFFRASPSSQTNVHSPVCRDVKSIRRGVRKLSETTTRTPRNAAVRLNIECQQSGCSLSTKNLADRRLDTSSNDILSQLVQHSVLCQASSVSSIHTSPAATPTPDRSSQCIKNPISLSHQHLFSVEKDCAVADLPVLTAELSNYYGPQLSLPEGYVDGHTLHTAQESKLSSRLRRVEGPLLNGSTNAQINSFDENNRYEAHTSIQQQKSLSYYDSYNKSSKLLETLQYKTRESNQMRLLNNCRERLDKPGIQAITSQTASYNGKQTFVTRDIMKDCSVEFQKLDRYINGERTETCCDTSKDRNIFDVQHNELAVTSHLYQQSTKLSGLVKDVTSRTRIDVGKENITRVNGKIVTHEVKPAGYTEQHISQHSNILFDRVTVEYTKSEADSGHKNNQTVHLYSLSKHSKAALWNTMLGVAENATYTLCATSNGKPDVAAIGRDLIMTCGRTLLNSVLADRMGGLNADLLVDGVSNLARGDFKNFFPSLITSTVPYVSQALIGVSLYSNRTHTVARAPLLGCLTFREVDWFNVNAALLYGSFSVGGFFGPSTTQFCRDGVGSVRKAHDIGIHATVLGAVSASVSFSAGTDETQCKTSKIDGVLRTEYSTKVFQGLLSLNYRVADRADVIDILPSFNISERKYTFEAKMDGTAFDTRTDMSLVHLKEPVATHIHMGPRLHEEMVSAEMAILSFENNGRIEETYQHDHIETTDKKMYGLAKVETNLLEYHNIRATETVRTRSDEEANGEHITTLSKDIVRSDVKDLMKKETKCRRWLTRKAPNVQTFVSGDQRLHDIPADKYNSRTILTSKIDQTAYQTRTKQERADNAYINHEERDFHKKQHRQQYMSPKNEESTQLADHSYSNGYYDTQTVYDATQRVQDKRLFQEQKIEHKHGIYQDKLSEEINGKTTNFDRGQNRVSELKTITATKCCQETNCDKTALESDITVGTKTVSEVAGETVLSVYVKNSIAIEHIDCATDKKHTCSRTDAVGTFLTTGKADIHKNYNVLFDNVPAEVTELVQSHFSGQATCVISEKLPEDLAERTYNYGEKNLKLNGSIRRDVTETQYVAKSLSKPLQTTEKSYNSNHKRTYEAFRIHETKKKETPISETGKILKTKPKLTQRRTTSGRAIDIKTSRKVVTTHDKLGLLPTVIETSQAKQFSFMKTANIVRGKGAKAEVSNERTSLGPIQSREGTEVETKSGLFFNTVTKKVITENLTDPNKKIKSERIDHSKTLSSGTSRALSTAVSGGTRVIVDLLSGNEVNKKDVANVALNTGQDFFIGHIANYGTALGEFAKPLAMVTTVNAVRAGLRVLVNEDDKRSAGEKVKDAAFEVVCSTAPSAISMGLSVSKYASKANGLATCASAAIGIVKTAKQYFNDSLTEKQAAESIATDVATTAGAWMASSLTSLAVDSAIAAVGVTSTGIVAAVISIVASAVVSTLAVIGLQKLISIGWSWWTKNTKIPEYHSLCDELQLKPDATQKEVESSYRKQALRVHPDKTGRDSSEFNNLTKKYEELDTLRRDLNIGQNRKSFTSYLRDSLKNCKNFYNARKDILDEC